MVSSVLAYSPVGWAKLISDPSSGDLFLIILDEVIDLYEIGIDLMIREDRIDLCMMVAI